MALLVRSDDPAEASPFAGTYLMVKALSAQFLDVVMHDEELDFRIQEVHVDGGSGFVGRSLGELDVQARTGAMLLAIRRGSGEQFEPHPLDTLVVPGGSVLIAFGTQAELDALAALAGP